MSQIQKKFIKADAVDESKVLLLNNGALRARNAADSADVSLMKLDGADKLQLLVLPQVSSDPVAGNDLVRKSHLDSELSTAAADVTALEGRVTAIEDDYGVAGGLATLDGSGKIPSSQVPAIAITDVYVVANIAARDALTVEEGDVAKVSDAGSGLPKTYIYDGASWIEIESGSDVDSVNGQVGVVLLGTNDILETGLLNRYYSPSKQTEIEGYADAAVLVEKNRAEGAEANLAQDILDEETRALAAEGVIAGDLAQEILDRAADVDAEESRALAAEGVIAGDLAQEIIDRAADVDAEESRALAAEGVLQGLVDALEAASLQWQPVEKFTLTAPMIAAGYVELSFQAVEHSIMASVDRLMIHHTDDYTVSVVGGKTRLTFVGSLVTVGQEKLSAGDVIRVQACKVAIV